MRTITIEDFTFHLEDLTIEEMIQWQEYPTENTTKKLYEIVRLAVRPPDPLLGKVPGRIMMRLFLSPEFTAFVNDQTGQAEVSPEKKNNGP